MGKIEQVECMWHYVQSTQAVKKTGLTPCMMDQSDLAQESLSVLLLNIII